MSRRKWFQVCVAAILMACLPAFSGGASAQGNSANAFERVKEVQERHTKKLMEQDGVVGTAVGLDEQGENALLILLDRPGVRGIPANLEGVPVRSIVTGTIYALAKPPSTKPKGKPSGKPSKTRPPAAPTELSAAAVSDTAIRLCWRDKANNETAYAIERWGGTEFSQIDTVGADTTTYDSTGLSASTTYAYRVRAYNAAGTSTYSNIASAQTCASEISPYPRPARIGTSTGHPHITAGTIACRVIRNGSVYALSNNHIYADENRAATGDSTLQPGPYDGGQNPRDAIGTLADFQPIDFSRSASNQIDAAIALCPSRMLDKSTPDGSYGTPSRATAAAWVGLAVKKHGRTTGLTFGQVSAVNATISVGYGSGSARFVNQIAITAVTPEVFSDGGDSGSLVVTHDGNNPVGLLFAGSSWATFANPIDLVLSTFGITVDGE
jgi:hypothetical protein